MRRTARARLQVVCTRDAHQCMGAAEWQQESVPQLTSEALMGPALAHAQSLGAESVASLKSEPVPAAPLSGPATIEDLQASFAQLGELLFPCCVSLHPAHAPVRQPWHQQGSAAQPRVPGCRSAVAGNNAGVFQALASCSRPVSSEPGVCAGMGPDGQLPAALARRATIAGAEGCATMQPGCQPVLPPAHPLRQCSVDQIALAQAAAAAQVRLEGLCGSSTGRDGMGSLQAAHGGERLLADAALACASRCRVRGMPGPDCA